MALARLDHWAERSFQDFLVARADMPFAWGTNDCALFAADAIEAITGTDIAADFRGKYTTQAQAMATISAVAGGTTIADAAAFCATRAGMTELAHPLMAQRGDLVVVRDPVLGNPARQISGVIHLNGREVVSVGEHGLKVIGILSVVRAWHY